VVPVLSRRPLRSVVLASVLAVALPIAAAAPVLATPAAGQVAMRTPAAKAATAALARSHAKVGAAALLAGTTPALDVAAARSLPPASTLKLFTVGAALTVLGPDHQFLTRVVATGAVPDAAGVLHGDLVLVAGGDPTLTRKDLGALAAAVAAAGVRRVTGSLRIDDSLLDRVRGAAGWRAGYVGTESGPLSALMLDDNLWRHDRAFLRDPVPAALALFRLVLSHRHVSVAGPSAEGPSPLPIVSEIAEHSSAPLSVIAGDVLRPSDNTEAEVLLKDLGAAGSGVGSTVAGEAAVRSVAASLGVAGPDVMTDGSGLSVRDRATADELVAWLSRLVASSAGPSLRAALPVSCRSGTLKRRLCGVAGRVVAKTGTLDATASLAGFATTRSGRSLVFAIVVSGRPWSTDSTALDRAVTALVKGL
jgi:D-alanyl-D-alanine carboxypeptidase/D-alanyl-D-alanine-endopeptidase (penicillin-binding protein 4)